MRLVDYLEFGGLEIANGNRSRDYLTAGLLTGVKVISAACGCDTTDEGPYISPSADPAPWYESSRPESADFLGLLAADIRLDAAAIRSVTPTFPPGGVIGPLTLKPRIVSVRGVLMASTMQGMAYGERWLQHVLTGTLTGCAPEQLRILLACPEEGDTPMFRTLRQVGIVDGPTPGPIEEMPECYLQEVFFQLASGLPWLYGDEMACATTS